MICKECQERGKNWKGSDPNCAFKNSIFDTDNWNCATMNKLRDLCEDKALWNNDQNAAIITGVDCDFIVITWYKRRGRTEGAYMLNDRECKLLTLEEAEKVIEFRVVGQFGEKE